MHTDFPELVEVQFLFLQAVLKFGVHHEFQTNLQELYFPQFYLLTNPQMRKA